MIGAVEILAIGAILLVPILILVLIFIGGKLLVDLRKDVKKLSEELKKETFKTDRRHRTTPCAVALCGYVWGLTMISTLQRQEES
ncbi:Uncharacterised protein [Corynebacterium renale]|nr:Uncharacterised protein [Corynebacterium renale]